MTDHYERSVDLTIEVEGLREDLRREYAREPSPRAKRVADLHGEIGYKLKAAGVHAQLATAQALHDLAANR